ncbi:hypothetical protein GPECTOR_11g44 [Gonium pectorale]|uniref:Transcription factor 25 n=1 Tax=Gonium pectorale TaxID=33097 RepID=A0A150GQ01_GONPE|nr:hypothetical protein GPECTOR_11g44 [Gonium pectorale]|eukprot:KXZ51917.1 hypothetical protein GPECTOR_11g44 [Gonium pectorale]
MATRHLRRLQEQAASVRVAAGKDGDDGDSEEEQEEDVRGPQKPFNPFDLLSDDDEPAQEAEASDQDRDVDQDGAQSQSQPRPESRTQPPPEPSQPHAAGGGGAVAGSSKSKKKKKKGGKQGGKQAADGSEDDAAPGPGPGGKAGGGAKGGKGAKGAAAAGGAATPRAVEEDIDAILRELNITTTAGAAASAAAGGGGAGPSGGDAGGAGPSTSGAGGGVAAAAGPSVLCVDMKGLRGDEELRRIFGSDVVAAVDRQDRAAAAEARRFGAAARGMGGPAGRRRGLGLKRGWLVAPKEHWPPCEGGLSMVTAGTKGGVPLFRYVHSPAYRDTQARFYRCQASYDPATIAALLQQAPYHADSLLAMHDLYRHMGENSYAEEMLDRALWALEAAWHPSFQPATATCRLDYGVEENRPLFGALFRHVQALSRRGCHRSALECCKLLLALEPEDPLGGLLLLDYLALRAGRYDWLQRFVLTFEGNRSLALLPNYAFALPMAAARAQQEAGAAAAASASSSPSAAAARAQPGASSSGSGAGGSASSPHDQLVSALLLHPLVLPGLVAKLQDKGAAKEPYWNELLSRRLFSGAGDGGSASLSHLAGLYVERSAELWKPPELLALLRAAAEEAADVAEGKRPPAGGATAADWAAVARESFPPSASNEYRHLRLADFSDVVNALPREEVEAAVAGGGAMGDVEDALADLQEQMILAAQERGPAGAGGGGGGGGAAPVPEEQLRGANPLLMLLRSLLPWVNAGQQPDYAADDAPAGAGGAAAAAAQQLAPEPEPEYDDEDGHLDDEEGVVRRVRR